jgi:hypothetical protein
MILEHGSLFTWSEPKSNMDITCAIIWHKVGTNIRIQKKIWEDTMRDKGRKEWPKYSTGVISGMPALVFDSIGI